MAARRRDAVIRAEPARADAHVIPPHVIAFTARAIQIGVLAGLLIGMPGAGLSTIWFAPQDGFDGWWTRLSAGFAIGSIAVGIAMWLLRWRIDLSWQVPHRMWWDARSWKLTLEDRHGRRDVGGWWRVALAALAVINVVSWLVVGLAW